jgi:anthranilate synthase component 1
VSQRPCLVKRLKGYSANNGLALLSLHQHNPTRYPYLLQSVAAGNVQARYDILFAFPGDQLILQPDDVLSFNGEAQQDNHFLNKFDRCWHNAALTACANDNDLPFSGGWFVFLAYELVRQIEPGLISLPVDQTLPQAMAVRIPAAIIHDHEQGADYIVAESEDLLNQLLADTNNVGSVTTTQNINIDNLQEQDADQYKSQLQHIKTYIREGDVFQVNLSRLWQAQLQGIIDNTSLYASLCQSNPGPFAGLAVIDNECAIISSSPERLLKTEADQIFTRPIAGTHPRGKTINEDKALVKALLTHPKERAEHIMLIDLERNDLGRVCIPGTVETSELMTVESYSHVHHIVSEVRGRLRTHISPGQVIAAVFPGGTITGCPKVRCMEIIAELELAPRGAYTGSMGYINHNGNMDLNILIRTMVRSSNSIQLRAGSGIVADSDPQRELEETRHKARGLLRALDASL